MMSFFAHQFYFTIASVKSKLPKEMGCYFLIHSYALLHHPKNNYQNIIVEIITPLGPIKPQGYLGPQDPLGPQVLLGPPLSPLGPIKP